MFYLQLLSLLLVLLSVVELVYYAGYQDEYVPPSLYIKPSVNIASFVSFLTLLVLANTFLRYFYTE